MRKNPCQGIASPTGSVREEPCFQCESSRKEKYLTPNNWNQIPSSRASAGSRMPSKLSSNNQAIGLFGAARNSRKKLQVHKNKKEPEIKQFQALGGDMRDRTADLLNAIQALSQLSYTPVFHCADREQRKELEKWWRYAGSNRRPLECHSSALPAELYPHIRFSVARCSLSTNDIIPVSPADVKHFLFFLPGFFLPEE